MIVNKFAGLESLLALNFLSKLNLKYLEFLILYLIPNSNLNKLIKSNAIIYSKSNVLMEKNIVSIVIIIFCLISYTY